MLFFVKLEVHLFVILPRWHKPAGGLTVDEREAQKAVILEFQMRKPGLSSGSPAGDAAAS